MLSGHFRAVPGLECTPNRFGLRLSRFTAVSTACRSSNERFVDPRCYSITIMKTASDFSRLDQSRPMITTAGSIPLFDDKACPRLFEHPVRKSACVCDHYSYHNYNNNYCY